MYIVNSTDLIPAVQKQWRTVSFAAVAANAGKPLGLSKSAIDTMHADLTKEDSFSLTWPKRIIPVMSPGPDLDAMSRKAIEAFAAELGRMRLAGAGAGAGAAAASEVSLWEWTRRIMVAATTDAVFGPQNPFRERGVTEAWLKFEPNFLLFGLFPRPELFFRDLFEAREKVAGALIEYMNKAGYETGSGLVKRRVEHHAGWGFSSEDLGRGELGNAFAVVASSTAACFWVLYHIFSDDKVLADVRAEVSALVTRGVEEGPDDGGSRVPVNSVDLARIKSACPILLSVFQETLRYRSLSSSFKMVLEDVLLDGRILLKKGGMLMIPSTVQHYDTDQWGPTAAEFDHLRFAPQKKWNRTAFRGFGGGHVLCPGRHFASNEIMALAAMMVLQFDLVPASGGWGDGAWGKSPAAAQFPILDVDVKVEMRPRGSDAETWKFTYSGNEEALPIVGEDIDAGGKGAM